MVRNEPDRRRLLVAERTGEPISFGEDRLEPVMTQPHVTPVAQSGWWGQLLTLDALGWCLRKNEPSVDSSVDDESVATVADGRARECWAGE
jgi:hypothetical protein